MRGKVWGSGSAPKEEGLGSKEDSGSPAPETEPSHGLVVLTPTPSDREAGRLFASHVYPQTARACQMGVRVCNCRKSKKVV